MTGRLDLDRVLNAYLAVGPEQLPDRVLEAALTEIDHTPQRRGLPAPWRFLVMSPSSKFALAAAAIVVAVVGGAFLLRPGSQPGIGGLPSSSPSSSIVPMTDQGDTTITFSQNGCAVSGAEALSTPPVLIDIVSERPELVTIDLWRIGQGRTYDELVAELAIDQARIEQGLTVGEAPRYLTYMTMETGAMMEAPGTQSRFVTIPPGTYAVICMAYTGNPALADSRALALFVTGPIEVSP